MISNICTLILYTLIIDVILFCALLIFCYIYNLRSAMKKLHCIPIKKLLKNNKLFIGLFLLFIFWAISIVLAFIGIADDDNSKYFPSDTLYSCYIAIIIGAVTIYFTVFAFIKPKKMTFVDYEALVVNRKAKFTYITIAFTFLINSIAIFININNLFFRTAILSNYLYIIIDLIFSIIDFNCLENQERATKIFVSSICKQIKHIKKAKKTINIRQYATALYTSYLLPCFQENSFNVAFEKIDQIIRNIYPDLDNEEYKQYIYEFSLNMVDIFNWFYHPYLSRILKKSTKIVLIKNAMDEIIKNTLVRILQEHESRTKSELETTIATAASFYEIWFKLYRKLFELKATLDYSDILKGCEPLSFGLMVTEHDGAEIPQNYIELYKNYLYNSYQLIIFILHNYNYKTFRSFLQDYIFTIQYISHRKKFHEIQETHNYYLIIIGTYIANLIQEKRISEKYIALLKGIIKEVETIKITYESFLYTETLSNTGIQFIDKDFHYYLLLMIIYSISIEKENDKKSFLEDIIKKIDLAENENHIYENLLRILNEMSDIGEKYYFDINLITERFEKKVQKLKEIEFQDLSTTVDSVLDDILPEYINKDKERIYELFNFCGLYKEKIKTSTNINLSKIGIPTGFALMHSCNYLIGKTNFDIMGVMDQFNYIHPYLYYSYIRYANKKMISSIDEIISDIGNLKSITLIIPIDYHSYFYTLENIKYEGKFIIYKDIKIKLELNRELENFIIIKDHLKESIFINELQINSQDITTIDDEENCKIDVKIPIQPEFYIDVNSKMTVYTIIGILNNNNPGHQLIKLSRNGE